MMAEQRERWWNAEHGIRHAPPMVIPLAPLGKNVAAGVFAGGVRLLRRIERPHIQVEKGMVFVTDMENGEMITVFGKRRWDEFVKIGQEAERLSNKLAATEA